MAAEYSTSVAFDKQELDDTVSCCICTDFYTDPKALPCIHTFCMKCLQQVGLNTNIGSGDEMPCPICRRKFRIPSEGFSGLPNNFFIAKLIEAANIQTKNHKMISIDEHRLSRDNVMGNLPPSVCVIHEQRVLDIYCCECKTVHCAVCFIHDHKNHEGKHVSKYVEDFRKQIENNIEAINGCNSKTLMKKAELIKIKEDMQQKVERLEEDILRRKGELRQRMDSHANSLLQSLSLLNQSKLKEIHIEADDVDSHLSCLQSYSSYCQKVMDKGSDSDICRAVSELLLKAAELQKQSQFLNEREIQFFMASFTKSEFEEFLEDDNLIGDIKDDCNSDQAKACTSKIALLRKQNYDMDLLKEEIKLERREKETVQLEVERLKVNNEHATNKTLEVDNDKLRKELETQKIELTDLLRDKELANEALEKTNTELRATILDVEQKRKREREALEKEKEKLLSQIHDHHELMGKLRSEYKTDTVLVQSIRTKAAEEVKKSIAGMTILDKELFVLHEESSEVEVYNSNTFLSSRRWKLNDLIQPHDIVSCNGNKCLYIFNYKGFLSFSKYEILRVDPHGKLIKKWSTGSNFGYSLSVTSESNIILPVYKSKTINEYFPDGQLIRKVDILKVSVLETILADPEICEMWHAIKLTNGHFVISLRSSQLFPGLNPMLPPGHGVCIVGGDGTLTCKVSYDVTYFSSTRNMNVPFHMFVDGNGFVMVVDRENGRVLLLDSNLKFKGEILSEEEKHGLRRPTRILVDESKSRLFVADNELNNQRILIFDVK